MTSPGSWLRCYRCWSQNLEVQVHYEGILKVDPASGEAADPTDESQEAVVQCLDCRHDQPHLALGLHQEGGRRVGRIEAVEDRWERMVLGSPWVASGTVTVEAAEIETCSGPEAAEALTHGAFGEAGTLECFTHVALSQARGRADRDPRARGALCALGRGGHAGTRGGRPRGARDQLAGGGVAPARRDRRRSVALATSGAVRRPPGTPRRARLALCRRV